LSDFTDAFLEPSYRVRESENRCLYTFYGGKRDSPNRSSLKDGPEETAVVTVPGSIKASDMMDHITTLLHVLI